MTPGVYKHYKGGFYRVLFVAQEATTGFEGLRAVIYMSLENGKIWCRSETEFESYVWLQVGEANRSDGYSRVKRFERVGD